MQRQEGEKARARLINRFEYGNDIDKVDNISAELFDHYCKEVERCQNPRGRLLHRRDHLVSPSVPFGSVVGATPDGRFAGEQLADGGLSPMLGQDEQGPTAVLKIISKLDNTLLSNGTLLNVKLAGRPWKEWDYANWPTSYGIYPAKLQHIQFNVVNADTLREAQQRPPILRAGGAHCRIQRLLCRTVEGDPDDIIRRTAHQL
ncbi:glycine radical domain-containing protein [Shigella flexneri]